MAQERRRRRRRRRRRKIGEIHMARGRGWGRKRVSFFCSPISCQIDTH